MAGFNGFGVYQRFHNWAQDALDNVKIITSHHDEEDKGFADGLSNTITRDGQSTITKDIPWNGKKITNLGDPVLGTDAANLRTLDNYPGWTTSKYISGTDLNGRLNFTGPSGVNGIGWSYADLSWLAKHGVDNQTSNRLVMNNDYLGAGTDVFEIDIAGNVRNTNGRYLHNLSLGQLDGKWHTPAAGIGTMFEMSGGTFKLWSHEAATTGPYGVPVLRNGVTLYSAGGHGLIFLDKAATGKSSYILGRMGAAGATPANRWLMQLGNGDAESGGTAGRVGSNFTLTGYANDGSAGFTEFQINRSTHLATFGADVTVMGQLNFDSILQSIDTSCILAAANGGSIYFRPNGAGSTLEQNYIDTAGGFRAANNIYAGGVGGNATLGGVYGGLGYRGKIGTLGAYQPNWHNMYYVSGLVRVYVDNSLMGTMNVTPPSDYRLKKGIEPLPGQWDAVKALRPVSYSQRGGVFDTFDDEPDERWGFLAHELQETLVPTAATGVKDGDVIQMPNPWTVIAALTSALQEAMSRIEALEAKLAT